MILAYSADRCLAVGWGVAAEFVHRFHHITRSIYNKATSQMGVTVIHRWSSNCDMMSSIYTHVFEL